MIGKCVELFRSDQLTQFLRLVSLPGDGVLLPVTLTALIAAFVFFFKKDRLFAGILLMAPLVGNLVKFLLKNTFKIPRPGIFGCAVTANAVDHYSFPSGHVVFITIIFGLLTYYSIRNIHDWWARLLLSVSLIFILAIGYSRVYLGAHWYLDVIGGYVVGGVILTISILVYNYLSSLSEAKDPEILRQAQNDREGDDVGN